jgi:uncharacterized protein YdcH (DUF465 family)
MGKLAALFAGRVAYRNRTLSANTTVSLAPLREEYHHVNNEIERIEENHERHANFSIEVLKERRLQLKDTRSVLLQASVANPAAVADNTCSIEQWITAAYPGAIPISRSFPCSSVCREQPW